MAADFRKHLGEDRVVVFEQDGTVLGYAVMLIDDESALLDNIAVDVDAQRQGIGKALIDDIERYVLSLGRTRYDLYTNILMTDNIGWYRKLGFTETKRVEEDGFKRVYMRKDLGSS